MNKQIGFFGWLLVALTCACTAKAPVVKPAVKAYPTIFHPLYFQDEIASQLNFPFWFNDSLIRLHNIQEITRTTFGSYEVDDTVHSETLKKTEIVYLFSREGKLQEITRIYYAEGLEIARSNYRIGEKPVNRYYTAEDISFNADPSTDYIRMVRVGKKKNVIQYDDAESDVRYHFFSNKRFWGALSVDSIADPEQQDWIIHGTPERPVKRYQVRNTVTENNVTHYQYLNENYPEMITWSDYPFTQKRYFRYDRGGSFSGFIDSTFIDQAFVTRNVTTFILDKWNRPTEIVHQKGHAASEASYRTIEKISYRRFPPP